MSLLKGGPSEGTAPSGGIILQLYPGAQESAEEGGGVCGLENSEVKEASATTHQGIHCHPGLGLLEAQNQRSPACGQLPTGAAEPGMA